MKLSFLQPVVSTRVDKAPALNGKLDASLWQGGSQLRLPFTKTDIAVRHDEENLYVAARRPSAVDRRGKTLPWAKTAAGQDAKIWDDDSFEVFLSDASAGPVVHLGVSASGARYDALSGHAGKEDAAWNGEWKSAVTADQSSLGARMSVAPDALSLPDNAEEAPKSAKSVGTTSDCPLVVELAIPWKTIEAAGLKKDSLSVNFQANQKDYGLAAGTYFVQLLGYARRPVSVSL